MNIEINYEQLKSLLTAAAAHNIGVEGYIVFDTGSSRGLVSDEVDRTYAITSQSPCFLGIGPEIFGEPIDGSEPRSVMNNWIQDETNGVCGWKIEKCYVSDVLYNRFSSALV